MDIWAVGCLYSEMMSGEPIFPGESDIDQLFQIVRVVGKLNSRHQLLITRNESFSGLKQEQNSSLHQLFPDWNRDSLDFLVQCLKMDGNQRPDTTKLLKHDLFTRDNFLDNFLVELRAKLNQELQGNPLLKRMSSYGSGRKLADEKKSGGDRGWLSNFFLLNPMKKSILSTAKKTTDEIKYNHSKDRISQIGLNLLSSQLSNYGKLGTSEQQLHRTSNPNSDDINLASLKHYLGTQTQSKPPQHKPISINNLVFKDTGKYSRILSAKTQKSTTNTTTTTLEKPQTNFDLQIQPPSPVQFQSLQPENDLHQQKRLSPVSITNLTINGNAPQYFNQKRSSNILGLQQVAQKGNLKQK